jgi:hypothetical protein
MLLKTHGEKISVYGLATMLMKINELKWPRHDVHDNKASYEHISGGAANDNKRQTRMRKAGRAKSFGALAIAR